MPLAAIPAAIGTALGVTGAGAAATGLAAIGTTAAVGASIYGANKGSSAAHYAANTATQAANEANDLQGKIYDTNKGLLSPTIQGGDAAGAARNAILGIGGDPTKANDAFQSYLKSTGYQFQFDQGQKAITSSRAASGSLDSGATLKALTRYGQGTASGALGGYLDRLGSVSQQGTAAAGALAGVGTGYAGQVGANLQNAANTQGNAALVSANQTNGLIGQGIGALGQYLGSRSASSYTAPSAGIPPELQGIF